MACECSGSLRCSEAVRLWDLVNAAYGRKDWLAYESAQTEYQKHAAAKDEPND